MSVIATGGVVLATPVAANAATFHYGYTAAGPVVANTASARLTQATLTVDKTSVVYGQSIVFTARLTAGTAELPVANQAVRLEAGADGSWKTVGRALVSNDGSVTFTIKPTATTNYRLAFTGSRLLGSSVSAARKVTVKPAAGVVSGVGPGGIGANGRSGSDAALAFLATAREHTGQRYVYAAAGPSTFDCSGLVTYVAKQFGLSLPHNADAQRAYGKAVALADAAPGDLVFYLDGGYAYHVAIYVGGNQVFDASNSRTPVGQHAIWGSNIVVRRIL